MKPARYRPEMGDSGEAGGQFGNFNTHFMNHYPKMAKMFGKKTFTRL